MTDILLALPIGLVIGLAVGALGGGGSVLAVPVLAYVFGESVPAATTESLAVVTAGALTGALVHARERRVCWPHAAAFTAAAVPGLVGGTAVADLTGGAALLAAFALVMLAAAGAIWRKGEDAEDPEGTGEGRRTCPPLRLPRDALAGVAIGFLTGYFGVGGGFLIVPTLAVGLAFTMRTAIGTSLTIIATTSALGLVVHLLLGRAVDADLTIAMTASCVAGAFAGGRLSSHVPQRSLAHGFAVMITAVAAYLVLSVAFLGGPPAP